MAESETGIHVSGRPIIFGAESVQSILSGAKTQTRRVVKHQPTVKDDHAWITLPNGGHSGPKDYMLNHVLPEFGCPYGRPGQPLYVKETHQLVEVEPGKVIVVYRATAEDGFNYVYEDGTVARLQVEKWRSPIFMPKDASRITLVVMGVRVERLHAIREPDVIAEGFGHLERPIGGFVRAWNDLNSKRGFPWHENPWVFVIDFRRVTA